MTKNIISTLAATDLVVAVGSVDGVLTAAAVKVRKHG